jgi:hypothetical protein
MWVCEESGRRPSRSRNRHERRGSRNTSSRSSLPSSSARHNTKNSCVSPFVKSSAILPELVVETQERAGRAAGGLIDPGARRIACERMERMRDEFRRKHSEVNVAVELIRES